MNPILTQEQLDIILHQLCQMYNQKDYDADDVLSAIKWVNFYFLSRDKLGESSLTGFTSNIRHTITTAVVQAERDQSDYFYEAYLDSGFDLDDFQQKRQELQKKYADLLSWLQQIWFRLAI